MPQKNKNKQIESFEKTLNELGIFNPFQVTEYKQKGRIVIASLDSVEKYDRDSWMINEIVYDMKNEPYVKLVGEFWYCGLLRDGKILYPLSEFKEFLETVKPTVRMIKDDIMYFKHPLSKKATNKIWDLEIEVQHIGTEFGDPEDDEIYLKINSPERTKKNNRNL